MVAIVIAIGGYFFPQIGKIAGSIASTDITATNLTEGTFSIGIQTPLFQLGGSTAASSIQTITTVTACSGAANATSTQFAVANPFAATGTSTATIQSISFTGEATTTSFQMGTSTQAVGYTTSNLDTVVSSYIVATSSNGFLNPGVPGMLSAGGGNYRTIAVAPSEYVGGYATSTATGAGANAYAQGIACSVKIKWEQ